MVATSDSVTARRQRSLLHGLAATSMVAGGTLAGAQPAEAGLIVSDSVKPQSLRDGRLELDIDGDQVIDFIINAHNYLGGVSFDFAGTNYDGGADVAHNYFDLSLHNYNPGLGSYNPEIGPIDRTWVEQGILLETDSNTGAFFNAGGILGLYFDIPGGTFHYGFLDMEGVVTGDGAQLNILSAGYESAPETTISSAAVPEPGSLALLALGVAGFGLWRTARTGSAGAG